MEPKLRHLLAQVLCEKTHQIDDIFRLSREPRAQRGILRRNADRAGIQVANAHHHAADGDERQRCKAELLRAEQRGDGDVLAGHELSVCFHADTSAQAVCNQCLVRLRKAKFPGQPRMLNARARARACSSVVAGDQDDVRSPLCHTGGNRSDARFGNKLDVDPRVRVCVLKVEDQLR
ncbi:hypothetical protein SDC9_91684 [bioreactor metagenome]|uniref:Uncharacterized protein n=1 Tax=bioreactor metagenome TaxID=1076179 RepID=A0A644ZVI6_9ZZZZ